MKHTFKKGLSWLLVLAMCVSLLSGITLTTSATSYTYNWGTRGTVADVDDFTYSAAEEWYDARGTSYEELSVLSGSSTTSSVPSSAMFQQLRSLMRGAVTNTTSYNGTKELFCYTDCQNGGGSISSFYSGTSIGPSWDGSWNREHTWPNSKGDANGSGENDIFMLRPTSTSENSSRGNTAYGEGSSYYHPNSESNGKYDLRGDCARIVLFVYVRWQDTSHSKAVLFGSDGVMESKEILLKWMEEDPVDTWELGRNDACQSITGTRNVFVDYPELGFLLFDEEVPADYQSPSGEGAAANYNITAVSNNTGYGTVSVSGNTITATPKTGYYASGYTVTSGTATVTQSGNTFKVSASSDCTVTINFAAKTAVTLTFMEDGVTGSTIDSYGGDSVTLPSNSNTPADGYTFVGWVEATVDETTEKPGTVHAAGSTVTAAAKTYYALYSRVDGENSSGNWQLVEDTSALNAGDQYIMAYNAAGKVAGGLNGKYLDPLDATFSADLSEITQLPDGVVKFTLGGSSGAWTFADEAGQLLGSSSEKTMTFGSGSNWTISITNGEAVIKTTAGTLQYNTSAPRFTTYANASQQSLHLYSMGGTVYYSTSTVTCAHENATSVAAVEPTCTESGYSAGVYCNDCNTYISGHEVVEATGHSYGDWVQTTAPTCTAAGVETQTCGTCGDTQPQSIAATGHSYSSVVTPPTTTEEGYTTYTCDTCGDSYVSDYVEALGEVYTVSFKVPLGVDAVADMECGKDGITLPTAGVPDGEQTYSFVGWSVEKVEDTETAPAILKAGDSYTATADITLYAVYSYAVGGTGESSYVKVTSEPDDWSGEYVIVYEASSYIFDGSLTELDNNGNYKVVTITDNTIASTDADAYKFTIEAVSGGYSIQSASGYYIGATGNSNSLNASTSTVYTNTISLDSDGNTNIIGSGGAYLRFNSGSPRFRYYKSSTYTGQKAIALYAKTESGTTYYTTEIGVEPAVAVYIGGALEAECATFEDALAYLGDSGLYLKLLQDVEAEVILEDVLYLDLNGHSISGILEPDVYSVTVFDSSTDSYNGDNVGYFSCTDINDDPVVPARHIKTDVTGAVKRYMTIETESGYTFHRFYMGITHASVKPGTVGVGYKAIFAGDDAVKAQIGSYGMNLWVEGNEAYTATLSLTNSDFVSGKAVTVRVDNIDVENYGETPLNAQVFMTLTDGTEIGTDYPSATVSMTLRQMVEKVNTNYIAYTSTQLAALKEMLDKYSITSNWTTANIK